MAAFTLFLTLPVQKNTLFKMQKKTIVKLYTTFKTQESKNHTLFGGTYILYTCLGQIKVSPFSGVCSWYTAILGGRNHVEVKKPAQSVRPVTVVIVYYMYGNNI